MRPRRLNYVSYGTATSTYPTVLEHLVRDEAAFGSNLGRYLKSSGLDKRAIACAASPFAYLRAQHRSSEQIAELLRTTLTQEAYFRTHGLRGCSLIFGDAVPSSVSLPVNLDLQFALMVDVELYYPPRVLAALAALRRQRRRWHMKNAVGWALGFEGVDGQARDWYIVNIQSDLLPVGPTVVREYFRHWHKILLVLIVREACARSVASVNVLPSEALASVLLPPKSAVPAIWRRYYDANASALGFRLRRCAAVDIVGACYRNSLAVRTDGFYRAGRHTLLRLAQTPFAWSDNADTADEPQSV